MMMILSFKERLKQFYSNFEFYLKPLFKILCTFIAFCVINNKIGYMTILTQPTVVGVASIMCGVLPCSLIVVILSLIIVGHLYALNMELAIIALILFVLMYLLYFKFTPKDGFVLFMVPIAFALNIPYVVPILVGLALTPVSIVSVAFGVLVEKMMDYVSNNAVTINSVSSDRILKRMNILLNGMFTDKTFYITMIVFAVVIIVVYILRTRSVDHAWMIAIIVGAICNVAGFIGAEVVLSINTDIETSSLVIQTVIAALIAAVFNICVFSVDYSRTEHLQFEDDEYVYYVKAVPKINIAAPEVSVKRINTRRMKNVTKKKEPARPQAGKRKRVSRED